MALLPEIKLRSEMFDVVYEVVKDIHTSPQNDISKFRDYNCSSYAILWNLKHSSKFNVSEDLYINIAINIESLKLQAAVLMEKKCREQGELYSVFQVQFLQSYDDKPPEWKVENRYFLGDLTFVDVKTDDRFKKIDGLRNLAFFCGCAYLTFPVTTPIRYEWKNPKDAHLPQHPAFRGTNTTNEFIGIGNAGMNFPAAANHTGLPVKRKPQPKKSIAKNPEADQDLIDHHENKKAAYIRSNFSFAHNKYGGKIRMTKRRTDIYKRDNYKCLKCGEDDIGKLTLDHIVPLSMKGGRGADNLQTLCQKCNSEKSSDTVDYRTDKLYKVKNQKRR